MILEPLQPFGLCVQLDPGTEWNTLDPAQIKGWLAEHKLLVFRGLSPLSKPQLPLAARRLGPIQAWSFGAVNVLEVNPDKSNYLFTEAPVPLHWDGAFKEEIPHILMFRCLGAPPPDAGGQTVFVDAQAVWESQSASTQERWKQARFAYETQKVVHYGGRFEAPLVQDHPLDQTPTLRFAEPVVGLNPVSVTALHPGAPSVEEVATALADPAHRTLHQWVLGDVVLADNHALLHGRLAFDTHAPRLIHRVNILDDSRPWWRGLVDSLRIRRPEFMVAEIPILLIPTLWLVPDLGWLSTWSFWEALVVFFALFHVGDMVNCLADRELDAVYKTSLSESVLGLGVRNVSLQIAVTAVVALGLTAHLAWALDRWWLLPLVAVGLVMGHQYSYGPLRLKGRGIIQFPALWTLIFVGPMLLMTGVVTGWPSLSVLALIGLYGAMAQSIILVNTAEDYDEDVEAKIYTSAVALGRKGAVWAACAGVGSAGAGLLALFLTTALAEEAPGLVWYALGLWTCAWTWATVEIGHLAYRVSIAANPDDTLKAGARKMPVWITAVAWLTLLVVGVRAVVSG